MALPDNLSSQMGELTDLFKQRQDIDTQIAALKQRRQEITRVMRQSTGLMRQVADAIDADPSA